MKEKIKNLLAFMGRAWRTSWKGKIAVLTTIFLVFKLCEFFSNKSSIQQFIINFWRLNEARQELVVAQAKLDKINHHLELLNENSCDYIQELGLTKLNIGDRDIKILKI